MEKSHTIYLTAHLKALEKKNQTHPEGVEIGNNQIEAWNQENRNKESNTKNQWNECWVFDKNQQDRQTLIQTNQKAER